jgi:hypothetical protein
MAIFTFTFIVSYADTLADAVQALLTTTSYGKG